LESNLFLAPGEGDTLPAGAEGNGATRGDGPDLADALRVVKGEIR
jgi:hypothetical protein